MCYGAYWGRRDYLAIGLLALLGGACLGVVSADIDHRTPAMRSVCGNNLKQLAIALHNYHDVYGSFPPAYVADENGRPMHTWRVLILPFIEQQALYAKYRLDEPWDGPNNRQLHALMPEVFRCPSEERTDPPGCETSYVAVVGSETCWPGSKGISLSKIRDGSSNTVLVAESHRSGIHWMEPRDLHIGQMPAAVNPKHGQGICSCHPGGAQIAFADGSVRFVQSDTPAATVRGMLTIDGGEKIELP
jgi:prepilin-type processing-associated H-X9-DG protein